MALILPVNGILPSFGDRAWLAPNSTIVGDVVMGNDCSVWFNAVIRGDVNSIRIGNQVNIQDGAVIHCTYQRSITVLGDRVSVGHNAIVHGCQVGNDVLIGMGAIVMDEVEIPDNVLIAAGAVVLEREKCESGYIYAGTPAKKVKELSPETFKEYIGRIANNYMMYADWFR